MRKFKFLEETTIGRQHYLVGDVILVKDAECFGVFEWVFTLIDNSEATGIPGLAVTEIT